MPAVILALDLGQHTGWALRNRDSVISSGVETFRQDRFQGGGMPFIRFCNWLDELSSSVGGLNAIYFEEVRSHAGTTAAHVYGGFLAHLTAWAERRNIPYQGVPVGTIKRHIAGRGNADKAAMIAAIEALGFRPADHNEADALALLNWAAFNTRLVTGLEIAGPAMKTKA